MSSRVRTFVDAGVLIAAARGGDSRAMRAGVVLNDPDREYVSSVFVQMEVLPKAVYHGQAAEVSFYEAFFAAVVEWADPASIIEDAFAEAKSRGLAALDALHVAAAVSLGAVELVTTEGVTKPIRRSRGVRVVAL